MEVEVYLDNIYILFIGPPGAYGYHFCLVNGEIYTEEGMNQKIYIELDRKDFIIIPYVISYQDLVRLYIKSQGIHRIEGKIVDNMNDEEMMNAYYLFFELHDEYGEPSFNKFAMEYLKDTIKEWCYANNLKYMPYPAKYYHANIDVENYLDY